MDTNVTCSEILDYVYCERRWYLRHMEKQQDENVDMVEGKLQHKYVDECHEIYESDKYVMTNVTVYNHDLNLFGICDQVEFVYDNNGISVPKLKSMVHINVVEHKHGKIRDCIEYKAQLASQVLCLEFMYKCNIKVGYIYFVDDDQRVEVEITEDLRNLVKDCVSSIINQTKILSIIKPKYSGKCKKCAMYDKCNPRNVLISDYLSQLWSV